MTEQSNVLRPSPEHMARKPWLAKDEPSNSQGNIYLSDAAISLSAFRATGRAMTLREARECSAREVEKRAQARRALHQAQIPAPTPAAVLAIAIAEVMDAREARRDKGRPQRVVGQGAFLLELEARLQEKVMHSYGQSEERPDVHEATARANSIIVELRDVRADERRMQKRLRRKKKD